MKQIKQKRFRIATVVTTMDAKLGNESNQAQGVACLGTISPRVFIVGNIQPPEFYGMKWDKTKDSASIKSMLASYLGSFSGNEVVMLTEPCVSVNPEGIQSVLDRIVGERLELAWAARVAPASYLMSAQVAAHLWADIPEQITMVSDWSTHVDEWMLRLLRHRYLDARSYKAISPLVPYEERPSKVVKNETIAQKRKQVVRKVARST